jgi:hypothetical protein
MALSQEYTCNQYAYPNAYIKAHIGRATVEETTVMFYVWPTQADRIANRPPVYSDARSLPTDFNIAAQNPIEYVYALLKTLPEFENAVDIME